MFCCSNQLINFVVMFSNVDRKISLMGILEVGQRKNDICLTIISVPMSKRCPERDREIEIEREGERD